MNILMVSSYLPYPLFSGGHIRLYNLIKELSRKHRITLICEKRDYQGNAEISELKKFCRKVITVDRKKQWTIGNILKTGLSFQSFLITGHMNQQMKKEIQREINESQFDLIHVETSYVMQNIPPTHVPLVLVEHNVEHLVYKRFADRAPLPLRPLLYVDVLKLRYWEENVWKRVAKLVAVSNIEKKVMSKIRSDVVVVSNGVDVEKFKPTIDQRPASQRGEPATNDKRILFIGEFKWVQNIDAIEWILKEIWPKLRAEFIPSMTSGIKLWVVGRNIPASIRKLTSDKSVIFDENAPRETEKIYEKSDLLIAPVRIGGGTSFKILEAMASGVPVITTDLGNAIGAKDNLEILIANDSDGFVQKIRELFANEKLSNTISENARKLVEKKYNWEKISEDLNSVYESIANYD